MLNKVRTEGQNITNSTLGYLHGQAVQSICLPMQEEKMQSNGIELSVTACTYIRSTWCKLSIYLFTSTDVSPYKCIIRELK